MIFVEESVHYPFPYPKNDITSKFASAVFFAIFVVKETVSRKISKCDYDLSPSKMSQL